MHKLLSASVFFVVASAACTVTSTQAGTDAGATPSGNRADAGSPGNSADSGGATNGNAPPLTCLEVLTCIGQCPDADANCPDACNAKGSPDAQAAVVAIAKCIDTNKCADAACAKAKCAAEVDTCTGQSATAGNSGGTAPPSTLPPGSIPAELVGAWNQISTSGGTRFEFAADGKVISVVKLEVTYPCTTTISGTSDGVAVAQGDSITIDLNAGTFTSTTCDGPDKPLPGKASEHVYGWSIKTDEYNYTWLTLVDRQSQVETRYRKE